MADEIKTSIEDLMKQAKLMQDNMQEAQKSLTEMNVTGTSHANLIKITMNGQHQVQSVELHNLFMDEDLDAMQDLILQAINDATSKIEKATKDKMVELTNKLGLPGGNTLPGSDG